MIRLLVWLLASLLGIVLAFAGFQYATRLAPHLAALDSVVTLARAAEPLSEPATDVFSRLVPTSRMADRIASQYLSSRCPTDLAPCQSQGRWHLDRAIWVLFLPLRRDKADLTTLYAHFAGYSTQTGIERLSATFAETSPANLTHREALGLLAISVSPTRYSPTAHPDAYLAKVESLDSIYRMKVR